MARYGYDLAGRRIAKRVYSAASGGTVGYTRFVYHGDQVAYEADSAGTIGLRFTWDRGTDRLAGVRDAAGVQYYAVTDLLGSVRGLVKQNGTWSMSQRFAPYGALVARDSAAGVQTVQLRFAWTGREFDAETGWYFHRARYYSPELRRFVQEDPSGDAGGSNRYAYVDGRVMEMVDPSGQVSVCSDGMLCSGGGSYGVFFPSNGISGWDTFGASPFAFGSSLVSQDGFMSDHLGSNGGILPVPAGAAQELARQSAALSGGPCPHPPCLDPARLLPGVANGTGVPGIAMSAPLLNTVGTIGSPNGASFSLVAGWTTLTFDKNGFHPSFGMNWGLAAVGAVNFGPDGPNGGLSVGGLVPVGATGLVVGGDFNPVTLQSSVSAGIGILPEPGLSRLWSRVSMFTYTVLPQ